MLCANRSLLEVVLLARACRERDGTRAILATTHPLSSDTLPPVLSLSPCGGCRSIVQPECTGSLVQQSLRRTDLVAPLLFDACYSLRPRTCSSSSAATGRCVNGLFLRLLLAPASHLLVVAGGGGGGRAMRQWPVSAASLAQLKEIPDVDDD